MVGLALSATGNAQGLSPDGASGVGMSAEELAGFEPLAEAAIEEGRLAGAVSLVVRRGRVVYEGVFGSADLDDGRPMSQDTIFRIASMTKPLTSVAIMILMEEGRLLLSDPVTRYVPAFKNSPGVLNADGTLTPIARPITLRDLLTHTAGLANGDRDDAIGAVYRAAGFDSGPLNDRDETTAAIVDRLAALPLAAQPGERFIYSLGTDVLGVVVENISGQRLDEFFRQRIFGPLQMIDSSFYLPPEKSGRLAAMHTLDADGRLRRGADDDRGWTGQGSFEHGPRRVHSGGGGLLSTAPDYARFLQMLVNGGELDGVRVLSPASVRLMTANHVGELYAEADGLPGMGFGFGIEIKLTPEARGYDIPVRAFAGSFAWGGAAYTTFWVDPEQDLVAIFMVQLRPYAQDDLSRHFGNVVYQAIIEP